MPLVIIFLILVIWIIGIKAFTVIGVIALGLFIAFCIEKLDDMNPRT